MFKRRTTKVRHRKQVKQLRASVMSPRIFLYDLRKMIGQVARMAALAALAGALVWAVWIGIREGLFKNDDFRLAVVELNGNTAIDQSRLFEVGGIDPEGSLFSCNVTEIEGRLSSLPELAGAKVKRDFPDKLEVFVSPRRPRMWVASREQGIEPRDQRRGLLVDRSGVMFRCTRRLLGEAERLPVIEVRGAEELTPGEVIRHPDFVRGRRLLEMVMEAMPGAEEWVDAIRQRNRWSSEMVTRDGLVATFGHEDLERQMTDLISALEHARSKGDRIATISLIGKRNLPVTFHETSAPKAIVVEEKEPEPPSGGNSDLRDLLER